MGLILLGLALDRYLEFLPGIVGINSAVRSGSRLLGFEHARGILLSVDDLVLAGHMSLGGPRSTPWATAYLLPSGSPVSCASSSPPLRNVSDVPTLRRY